MKQKKQNKKKKIVSAKASQSKNNLIKNCCPLKCCSICNLPIALAILFVVFSFIISFYFLPFMPEQVASHWGINGEADGFMPKIIGIFLLPVLSIALIALMYFFPKFDPMKTNIDSFKSSYHWFITIFSGFFFYLQMLIIAWNLNLQFDFTKVIIPAFAVLFFYCGKLIGNAKQNWFIGIRTPWTLSNKIVWEKTHKLGAKVFKIMAVMILLSSLLPNIAFATVIILLVISAFGLMAYSYFEFQKQKKK